MKQKRIKKAVFTAAAVAALTGGSVAFAVAYRSGYAFDPTGKKQEFQANQVVFPGDESMTGDANRENSGESELWEKEENSSDKDRPQEDGNTGYLFENKNLLLPESTDTLTFTDQENQTPLVPDLKGGNHTVYDIVEDTSTADLVIAKKGEESHRTDEVTVSGSGEKDSISESVTETEQKTEPDTVPKPTPIPTQPDTSSEEKPDASPADSIKDILPANKNQTIFFPDSTEYTEENVKNATIEYIVIEGDEFGDYQLYKGQRVSQTELFYVLTTYVMDSEGKVYLWNKNALNQYIRIDGVSFDGGASYLTDFPVKIPEDLEEGEMQIRVGYRLSLDSEDWTEEEVLYHAADSRIYLLSQKRDAQSDSIDETAVLNPDGMNQCLAAGSTFNLLTWLDNYLGEDYLTGLFPGWTENGKTVPWYYEVTSGRHILEPAESVDFDTDTYDVRLEAHWMSDTFEEGSAYRNLCYLQTLERYWGGEFDWDTGSLHVDSMKVPEYIQGVNLDGGYIIDEIELPSTVLYVNCDTDSMRIDQRWIISGENPVYASDENGLLYNKAKTKILGIPYSMTKLTVPDTIESVDIPAQNQISAIQIESADAASIPDIDYSHLSDCRIIVAADQLIEYLENNYKKMYQGKNLTAATSADADVTYCVRNQAIVSSTGSLRKALKGSKTLHLAKDIQVIETGAFRDNTDTTTLVLSKNQAELTLEEDCFQDSHIEKIICQTSEQKTALEAQLGKCGKTGIQVALTDEITDGFGYLVDGAQVTLLSAPSDITEFDGTIETADGTTLTVTAIGDGAFEGCTSLQWVILPESVTEIGSSAFKNCSTLEGIFIDTRETITIGNEALDGCTSLRFFASNAKEGIMESGYNPELTGAYGEYICYIPTDAEGYGDYFLNFTEDSDVCSYRLVESGDKGKLLYGVSNDGEAWMLLRSSRALDAQTVIADTTSYIWPYALSDTVSTEGAAYSIDFERAKSLWYIGEGAFKNSAIEEVKIAGEVDLGKEAFAGSRIKSIRFGSCADIFFSTFEDCNALEEIQIGSETPCNLSSYTLGFEFSFNTNEEWDESRLKIRVPEGSELEYVKKWRYYLSGYSDYRELREYTEYDLWDVDEDFNLIEPTEEQITAAVEEILTRQENRARAFLGMDPVESPTDIEEDMDSGDEEEDDVDWEEWLRLEQELKEQELKLENSDSELEESQIEETKGQPETQSEEVKKEIQE